MMLFPVCMVLLALGAHAESPATPPSNPNPACAGDTNGVATSSATFAAATVPNLVPWPKAVSVDAAARFFYPNSTTAIVLNASAAASAVFKPAAELLAAEIALVSGGARTSPFRAEWLRPCI